jgi:universal stress protein E
VLAAVDLGTRVRSKQTLNDEIVEQAAAMASLRRERERRAEEYRRSLSQRGITIDGLHVVTGRPAKALGSLAAQERIRLVVLGCVGRRKLAGRVIGNTAEQILRLLKADVLAVKPGSRASVAS